MKRVVMLSPNFHPHVGGAEKQALELSCALQRKGACVVVLTRARADAPARENVRGVRVVRLPVLGRGFLDSLSFLAGAFAWLTLHAADYDAVHVHLAGSPALAAGLAARLFGKRAVVKVGGGRGIGEIAVSSETSFGRIKLRLLGLLRPQFVCVAEDLRAELEEHGLGKGALVVPNGVDPTAYAPAIPEVREALRRELGLRGCVFLYAGRLSREKRLPEFLESFRAALESAGTQVLLALVGSGPEEARIRERVERLGLGERVRLFPAARDVVRFYRAADVFVLPSVSEGLSNALLEAMACGLAVLASRVGGTPEAVTHGESGLLFDPGDPRQERARIESFLRDPELAPRLGKNARRVAQERFSLEAVADRYLGLY